ncbi:MAG TPA: tetratricopeptide repeat protein [Bacteroidales bacterium]|nr:tetratricopeptide repeat protein [Bacteroidales bacterium]
MNIATIIQQHKKICTLISQKKVKQSLDIIESMLVYASYGGFRDEFEDNKMTYLNILKYTMEGVDDPERKKIYNKFLQDILKLSDRIKQDILARYSGWYTYNVRKIEEKEESKRGKTIIQGIDDLAFKSELDRLLESSEISVSDDATGEAMSRRNLTNSIFNHLWLTDYYGDAEENLVDIIRHSEKFQWHEIATFVSAITLSSFRIWDSGKIKSLVSFYSDERQSVSERALTGLILSLYAYDNRLHLYPDIIEILKGMATVPGFRERCQMVVLQTIRSRETEKLSRRMNEEILPKVVKMKPDIEEKLDLDSLLGKDTGEDRNPDWSDMFKESEELYKTMEELAKLQMEGSDVYMSAFSGLKNFDFFREFRNWFMPFYPDNEAVDTIFGDKILGPGINELAEALYKTPFICNSDKFSLILNLKNLPDAQKSMMLKVFRMELDGLEQMKYENEFTDPQAVFRTTVTQYIHDLYRFYKLSDNKNEFDDIFKGKLDIYNCYFFKKVCSSFESEAALADFFFSKDFYSDALSLYLSLLSTRPDDAQLNEKAGYCYQQEGNYDEALKYYKLAIIIEPKSWSLKKAGLCLRKLENYKEALDYYLQAMETKEDDLHAVLMAAHCYLDLHDYDNALKSYFRIEYDDPSNTRVIRPIAWCYLATGRLEESAKYFARIDEESLTSHDNINMGHLALCRRERKMAAEYYLKAITNDKMTAEAFINTINEDCPMLFGNGVNPDEIPLIVDFVMMNSSRK